MIFKQLKTIFKSFVEKKFKAFLESTMSGSSHQNHSWNCVAIRIKTIKEQRKVGWLVGFLFCFVLFCHVEISQTIATWPLSPTCCALGAQGVGVHGCGFIMFRTPTQELLNIEQLCNENFNKIRIFNL